MMLTSKGAAAQIGLFIGSKILILQFAGCARQFTGANSEIYKFRPIEIIDQKFIRLELTPLEHPTHKGFRFRYKIDFNLEYFLLHKETQYFQLKKTASTSTMKLVWHLTSNSKCKIHADYDFIFESESRGASRSIDCSPPGSRPIILANPQCFFTCSLLTKIVLKASKLTQTNTFVGSFLRQFGHLHSYLN